jgi:hypothetical protein
MLLLLRRRDLQRRRLRCLLVWRLLLLVALVGEATWMGLLCLVNLRVLLLLLVMLLLMMLLLLLLMLGVLGVLGVLLVLWVLLMLLLRRVLLLMLLLLLVMLMLRLHLVLRVMQLVRLMRLLLRMRLVILEPGVLLVRGVRLLLMMREYSIMLHRLAHGAGKQHRRRVPGRLHLLPRRSRSLTCVESIGDVGCWRSRRPIGHVAVDGARCRGEQVLRIRALRSLLRLVRLRLVRRSRMRSGRLLVRLVWIRVWWSEARITSETGLGEVETRMGVGPRGSKSRHCGR